VHGVSTGTVTAGIMRRAVGTRGSAGSAGVNRESLHSDGISIAHN
jgi:hypothetical protein